MRGAFKTAPITRGGPRLAPRHATSPHIGISRSRASFLNNELRGSEHDPHNERERARIQQEMEDESGHGTLPITTQSPRSSAAGLTPLLKLGGKVTARCPKFKQRYPRGGRAPRLAGARSIKCPTRATSRGRCHRTAPSPLHSQAPVVASDAYLAWGSVGGVRRGGWSGAKSWCMR